MQLWLNFHFALVPGVLIFDHGCATSNWGGKLLIEKLDICLQQILMECPRLAETLDTLMFKSFFMNVSSPAVISLCTSIIFFLIPLIFFQIKSYSHLHYHLNARRSQPFRHICADCHTTAAFKARGFCSRTHEYVTESQNHQVGWDLQDPLSPTHP